MAHRGPGEAGGHRDEAGIGISLTLLLFDQETAFLAILATSLGDGVSTLSGMWFGRHPLPHNKEKSIEGSLAGFAAALGGGLLVAGPYQAALAAVVGMVIESLPSRIDDNLTIPLGVGVIVSLFG
jgi:dolichol kinase